MQDLQAGFTQISSFFHCSNLYVYSQGGEVVGHTAKRVFHWAPEISNGTEEDLIVMPNVPLLGAINKMRADGRTQFEINAFTGMLRLVVC